MTDVQTLLKQGKKTVIMGILNITPDSFSDGGRFLSVDKAVEHAKEMEKEGADIIDVGGESTRPGAKKVTVKEEMNRVMPVIERLSEEISIPLSIDTYKSEVAEQALKFNVEMVNDVSALRYDPNLGRVVAKHDAFICLMHMKGNPRDMQINPYYEDVVFEIKEFLKERIDFAVSLGIEKKQIIIDPGIGFGKRTGGGIEDNCEILKRLSELKTLKQPILVGASRKTFIGNIISRENKPLPPWDRLEGSLAAACVAVMNGADIIRVHDVGETRRCMEVIDCIVKNPMLNKVETGF